MKFFTTVVLHPGIRRPKFAVKNGVEITVNRKEWNRLAKMGDGNPARGIQSLLCQTINDPRFLKLSKRARESRAGGVDGRHDSRRSQRLHA